MSIAVSIIESLHGFLCEDDLSLLDNLCTNFKVDTSCSTTPAEGNSYYRMVIDKETNFIEYQNDIKDYVYKKYKLNIEISSIWINRVIAETNKDDDFHYDDYDLTFISYINDNFEGGEFEFQRTKRPPSEKIKPKRNLSLITNRELPHRVLPVTFGERYSLIVFCKIVTKNIKTIL